MEVDFSRTVQCTKKRALWRSSSKICAIQNFSYENFQVSLGDPLNGIFQACVDGKTEVQMDDLMGVVQRSRYGCISHFHQNPGEDIPLCLKKCFY